MGSGPVIVSVISGALLVVLFAWIWKHPVKRDKFTCPRCGMTSFNPNDIAQGYCGNCHDWTGK